MTPTKGQENFLPFLMTKKPRKFWKPTRFNAYFSIRYATKTHDT